MGALLSIRKQKTKNIGVGLALLVAIFTGSTCAETVADGGFELNDNAEIIRSANWVEVNDPYIEFHTGPGARYPIVYVVERGDSVEILKEKTGWFKVVTATGESGWVSRSQMEKTLLPTGTEFTVTDVSAGDFGKRTFEGGVGIGDFEGARLMSIYLDYRFSETLSAEVSLYQINGNFSSSQLVSVGFINQPFSNWSVSPFMFLGTGAVQTDPKTALVQSEQRTDQIVTVGLGVKAYLTKRFILRAEYKEHIVLTNRSKNEKIGEWKTGFSVFF
ncbi:MAG: SH3 domain-containing protein [Pseudomonadales bacterium]|nr:SH3 domain-containing protein [Pseudomonadales bacterium]